MALEKLKEAEEYFKIVDILEIENDKLRFDTVVDIETNIEDCLNDGILKEQGWELSYEYQLQKCQLEEELDHQIITNEEVDDCEIHPLHAGITYDEQIEKIEFALYNNEVYSEVGKKCIDFLSKVHKHYSITNE